MLHAARWWIVGPALVVALMLAATGGMAQYTYPRDYGPQPVGAALQTEVKTALTHAGFAATYDTMKEVTLHLHHVVNCLVGSKDKMFDATAGNPCEGQGNGIIADIPASMGTRGTGSAVGGPHRRRRDRGEDHRRGQGRRAHRGARA